MRRLTKFLLALTLLAVPQVARGTDIPVFPTGPVFSIKNLVWGTSTVPGINNNFFFTPINLNENVCVYVYNNNPTNTHTVNLNITVTGNTTGTPSDGTWTGVASSGLFTKAAPGFPAGLNANISGVSQVALAFTGSIAQAGNPDTANIVIVQTQGNCMGGINFVGSSQNYVSALPAIQAVSDNLGQAYFVSNSATNPANAQDILHINANNTQNATAYLDRVVITASATANVNIILTTTVGTTCTSANPASQKFAASSPQFISNFTCTVHPVTSSTIFNNVPLSAGIPVTLDLRGVILVPGANDGIDVSMAAALAAGTISVTYFWYEK